MRSIHALALALILAPLVVGEPPPSAAAAAATTAAAVPAATAAAQVPPLAEPSDNSGDLTSGVRGMPSAKWTSIGPTKPAMTADDEGNSINPGPGQEARSMAAVADDASSNATQVQPAFQVGSVVPMGSADDADAKGTQVQVQQALPTGPVVPTSSESKKGKGHADEDVKVKTNAKDEEEFLDVMLRGRRRLQSCGKYWHFGT